MSTRKKAPAKKATTAKKKPAKKKKSKEEEIADRLRSDMAEELMHNMFYRRVRDFMAVHDRQEGDDTARQNFDETIEEARGREWNFWQLRNAIWPSRRRKKYTFKDIDKFEEALDAGLRQVEQEYRVWQEERRARLAATLNEVELP